MSGDEDDRDAFAAAMRGVKRLRAAPRVGRAPPPKTARRAGTRAAPPSAAPEPTAMDGGSAAIAGRTLRPSSAPLVKQLRRRLRRGELEIAAELDLHGATAVEAPALLDAFLDECREHGVRCARVVHGKGRRSGPEGPVLKGIVHERLARAPGVLGFVTAEPRDGGSGAVLVFLGN
ncbi:MAG TPA: Smr/MutS family protein [Gammaproteobacteria bacterium]|nr:Smr/MutS family protein [Gammaproteobacteria bacterium]